MADVSSAPEIAWPSLSDLSDGLGARRQLDTLGREVARLRLRTAKVGRERRMEPDAAVKLLRTRGLPARNARAWVAAAVRRRLKEVPALRETGESGTSAGPSPYREAVIADAALRYDEGHRPVLELPHGRADFGSDELRAAIRGGER